MESDIELHFADSCDHLRTTLRIRHQRSAYLHLELDAARPVPSLGRLERPVISFLVDVEIALEALLRGKIHRAMWPPSN